MFLAIFPLDFGYWTLDFPFLIDIGSRVRQNFWMLFFPPNFRWLYPTVLIVATLCACQTVPPARVPVETIPAEAPAPEVKPPSAPALPSPPPPPSEPREVSREREELLKFQEAVRVFREEEDAPRAFEMLDAFLSMHPDSPYADDAMLEQARIWLSLGKRKKALTSMERLLKEYPSSPTRKRTFIEMVGIYSDLGKWKDCVEASRSALTLDPLPDEESRLLVAGGVCKSRRRDHLDAAADIIRGYHAAMSPLVRQEALQALEEISEPMKDRKIEGLLEGSDGSEPYGILAITLLGRHIDKGERGSAMAELMDIMIYYPETVPGGRLDSAYSLLRDRLMVRTGSLGVLLPLTGQYAFYGQKALQGIQAVFGFQTSGSGPGVDDGYNLVIKDSGADPLQAAQAVRDLAEIEQVLAVIGPIFSRTTRAAALAAEESGIPMISLSPDPEIPGLGENIFRRSLGDTQQIESLVRLTHDRLGMTRFAFLYPDNSYGNEMMNIFWDKLDMRGAQIVAAESFPPGQTDFGPQIRGMVGLNRKMTPEELARKEEGFEVELEPIVDFDALFIPADFQTVGLIAPQLAFYEVNEVLLVGTDGWNSPWLAELGEHYVEGALFTGGIARDLENEITREMTEKYWLTFGEDPLPIAVQAYDAAYLIKSGIESGGVRDRSGLREFLLGIEERPSAEGPLTTDEKGDIIQRPLLLTVVDGEIVPFQIQFD